MRQRFALVLLMCLFSSMGTGLLRADVTKKEQSVSTEALNSAIDEVIAGRHFQWRMPRDAATEDRQLSALEKFLEGILDATTRAWKAVRKWYEKMRDWLRLRQPTGPGSRPDFPIGSQLPWLIGAMILVAGLLVWVFVRRRKRKHLAVEKAQAMEGPLPEISREDITADLMPEDSWLKMAHDLLEKGEARLALRAMFMAILADLSSRDKITISRFKSNHEYAKELIRRAHYAPDLGKAFSENIELLEQVWYGSHSVTGEMIQGFQENRDRIKRAEV